MTRHAFRHHGPLRKSPAASRCDANGQSLAYCYGRETQADADIAKVLTMDNARRIAANIAKLPELLGAAINRIPKGAADGVFHACYINKQSLL